ncbi:hypothetical protein ACU1JV_00365 [Paenibacillus sp. T2-29]|uniref:hypothetical protein n=1 Tax=Paenibacillus TaxID=44249 RepID=UPI0039BD2543
MNNEHSDDGFIKKYWSRRIYDEILSYPENMYEKLSFDIKDMHTKGKRLDLDIKLSIQFGDDCKIDDIDNTMTKITKTLELLIK